MRSIDTIKELIHARYPIIYVVSSEEARVEEALKELGQSSKRPLHVWSITKGLIGPDGSINDDCDTPPDILEAVEHYEGSGIFLLKDFHPYINDSSVCRGLRDLAAHLKEILAKKHVVLLSPQEDVPKDLETDIAVVDFELPDRECLDGVVQDCLNVYPKADVLTVNSDITLRSRLVEAGLGLSRSEFENVLARSLARCKDLDLEVVNEEKEAIIRRNGILEFYRPKETTDDIGGLGDLVSWLSKRGSAFGKQAREYGLPAPKGVLIVGIPGTGKSLTAKAVGNLWKLPLLRLDMGKVFGSLVGESEANIRKVIQTAEAVAPCVMWIDEMEKALSGTGSSGDTDSGVTARVFGSVLTWLSEKESPVFVVATANDISSLPPELLRKGRLDEIFFVDLPDAAVREEIFRIHLAKKGRDVDRFSISELASASDGFSGAEIEQAVISALYDSFDDEERELTTADILKSIKETVPLSTTMRTNIEAMRDWAKNRARMAQASRGNAFEPQPGTRFDVT